MKKKTIMGIIVCISLTVIIVRMTWGISIYRREQDPNWQIAKKLYNVESALQEIDESWELTSLTKVTPYCYQNPDGDTITYYCCITTYVDDEPAEYFGCGFSADEPMGGIELNGGTLLANMAEMIIPALEGDDGEQILAFRGNQIYGNLKRRGSTNSHNFRNCIDIYDVLLVTRQFKIKRLRLYFNGYFTRENRYLIKLPQGFHLNPWSEEAQIFKVSN